MQYSKVGNLRSKPGTRTKKRLIRHKMKDLWICSATNGTRNLTTLPSNKAEVLCKLGAFTKRSCLAIGGPAVGSNRAHLTIKFRIDLQDLWSSGYLWDDILHEDVLKKWAENLKLMNHLLTLQFDQKLKPTGAVGPPQIHGFSDARKQSYGAVIFLRWQLEDGSFCCVPVIISCLLHQ